MDLHGDSVKRAVSNVLEQAFYIELDDAELEHYSKKIAALLAR